MKKFLSLITILVILITVISACSSSSTSGEVSKPANSTGQSSGSAPAELTWPTQDVTVYVASSPGGGTDLQARIISEYFKKITGHNLIIQNQTSGSGTVAYEQGRTAKPDGNTLLYYHVSMNFAYYSGVYKHNILESFTPIAATTSSAGMCIVVPENSPYNSLDELVAAAKKSPDTIIAGIQVGGFPEYFIRLLEMDGKCTFKCVDAGNDADRTTALLGKHIDVTCISPKGAAQYEKSGDFKVLGMAGEKRHWQYPQYPTTIELGYPNVKLLNYLTMYAPSGIDPKLAEAMNKVFVEIGNDPDYQTKTKANAMESVAWDLKETQAATEAMDKGVKKIFELF